MKLSAHQKRILAALLELERRFGHRWWGREAIGYVVGAGGFHQVIQTRTMLALSSLSLVLLEVESWPAQTRRLVHCSCAAYHWGLTDAGRSLASSLAVRWPATADDRFRYVAFRRDDDPCEGRTEKGDRFVRPAIMLDDDDDDPADHWKG